MVSIVISGIAGRMGTAIAKVAEEEGVKIAGATETKNHPIIGSVMYGVEVVDDLSSVIEKGDVVIEFTTPEATVHNTEIAESHKKPIVIGTTGLSSEQMAKIKECAKQIPLLYSANMSIGMNLIFGMIGDVAKRLPDYDVEIVEVHHHHKVDAPSGTAKRLVEIICEKRTDLKPVYGRSGKIGERKRDEIGIFALRAGDIVGEHTVLFCGEGERIEITHRVHRREAFAYGAIRAASFLVQKDPGFYTMADIFR
jgi:4-hydroxy-tetrahydrodipicolinate reductase